MLSAFENERLRSMFADAKTNQSKPPKSKAGEYMIAVGEDFDNKIAYMQGEIDNPIITRVLTIDEYDETEIDKARRNIYDLERRGIQQETKGVLRLYRKTDFGSYATYERNVKENEIISNSELTEEQVVEQLKKLKKSYSMTKETK